MPVPPQGTDEEKEQLNLLRRRIDFEKANPEHVDAAALKVLKKDPLVHETAGAKLRQS